MSRPTIAVTLGDPVGIGPEITALTLAEVSAQPSSRPIAVGDRAALQRGAQAAGIDLPVNVLSDFRAPVVREALNIVDTGVLGDDLPPWGQVHAGAGAAAVTAIEVATTAAMAGSVEAIVTGPIHKEAIWTSGSTHLGHTEMLGELTGVSEQDTMFVVNAATEDAHTLRVFFATRHMSLREAVESITQDRIVQAVRRASVALTVFGVPSPRIGLAALNPHGGEGGAFGTEEITELRPAVEQLVAEGLDVIGPIPADSIFHQGVQGHFDGIMSLYHDQGHIPTKTLDFDGTVSVTVGLPILRTSVDHGTAFDIAGTGRANHHTMLSAYRVAEEFSRYVPNIRETYGSRP